MSSVKARAKTLQILFAKFHVLWQHSAPIISCFTLTIYHLLPIILVPDKPIFPAEEEKVLEYWT